LDSNLSAVVVVLTGVWLASAAVALLLDLRSGAILNMFSCGTVAVTAGRAVATALSDRDAYARLYGAASLSDLGLIEWSLAASLLAFALTLVSYWRGRIWFALGWLANAPTVALAVAMVFWLRIFS
jgi:hypothetical protein